MNVVRDNLIDKEIKRIANSLGCKAKYDPKANQTTTPPGFYSQTIPSAFKNSIIRDYHCGAKFVAFSAMEKITEKPCQKNCN